MRLCKLVKAGENLKIISEHGLYAEVQELIESPSGYKAKLRFGDDYRAELSVRRLRMIQDENVVRSPHAI
tara:strand:- start:478 stop:687 length:210 start_codon:yes stop_codon:yes gene_type:complete